MIIIEALSASLGISIAKLLTGEYRINYNVSANMLKSKYYVCPICGNLIYSIGEVVASCCGIILSAEEEGKFSDEHGLNVESADNKFYNHGDHLMAKNNYISFVAYVTGVDINMTKLYPEGDISLLFRKIIM